MELRISSVCCLVASAAGVLGLGGGGTGPVMACCELTFRARA